MAQLQVRRWPSRAEAEQEVAAAIEYCESLREESYLEELATMYAGVHAEHAASLAGGASTLSQPSTAVSQHTLRRFKGDLALMRGQCWQLEERER